MRRHRGPNYDKELIDLSDRIEAERLQNNENMNEPIVIKKDQLVELRRENNRAQDSSFDEPAEDNAQKNLSSNIGCAFIIAGFVFIFLCSIFKEFFLLLFMLGCFLAFFAVADRIDKEGNPKKMKWSERLVYIILSTGFFVLGIWQLVEKFRK